MGKGRRLRAGRPPRAPYAKYGGRGLSKWRIALGLGLGLVAGGCGYLWLHHYPARNVVHHSYKGDSTWAERLPSLVPGLVFGALLAIGAYIDRRRFMSVWRRRHADGPRSRRDRRR
jgi:hypothetical protein